MVPGRTTRLILLPTLSVALTLLAAACGGAGDESGPQTRWTAAVDTVGDTVIVRTISGQMWGSDRTLVSEVSIGVLDGDASTSSATFVRSPRMKRAGCTRTTRTGPC